MLIKDQDDKCPQIYYLIFLNSGLSNCKSKYGEQKKRENIGDKDVNLLQVERLAVDFPLAPWHALRQLFLSHSPYSIPDGLDSQY